MSVYLRDIPLAEAQDRFHAALKEAALWQILAVENLPLDEHAIGRVLAEPVWAKISSPHYHASAMDGFALRAADTLQAGPATPVTLLTGAAGETRLPQARYLDTGDPLPEGLDAVVPIEQVESLDLNGRIAVDVRNPASIRIRAAVPPWSHVRPLGEDIVASQLVLTAGQVLRPADLGALAAAGHDTLRVARKPRVAILPTGSELVRLGSELPAGAILEYNSIVLAAQVSAWGGLPERYPILPDDLERITAQVLAAAQEHDLVLLNAGSSAGAEDFSSTVIEKLGQVLVHGVAVRPGHPVILGLIDLPGSGRQAGRRVPVVGVPGYPVSAALTCEIFIEPLLARWTGRTAWEPQVIQAQLTRKVSSPAGDDDYVRVAVGRVAGRVLAAPLARGAGVITSLSRADGIIVLPRGVQGAEAGDNLEVRLYRSQADVERTIFCIGSHDMCLDLLAQFLEEYGRRLSSANVGSLGGLLALKRGEAHLAGSHLLDPGTGVYNLAAIAQYLPQTHLRVYAFVERVQGLMVRKGNPLAVRDLADLARNTVRFVNRQRGAGTRVLLDYQLDKMGIHPDMIQGYNQEEYTHLGVAAAVASGRADCGLGIPAAAQALNLDFVDLFSESYQLVIPVEHAESPLVRPLFEVLQRADFKAQVERLPGYGVQRMGELVAEV